MTAVMAFSAVRRGSRKSGKYVPLAQLRDPDIHRPGTRLPRPGTVSIAVVHPLRAALVGARAAQLVDVQRHQAISNEAQHLGQQLSVRRL
jgi:hypothetical protein